MHVFFSERGLKSALREHCKGAGTAPWAKLGKGAVAGVHRGPKWDRVQADLVGAQDDQDVLTLCSGILTLGSGKSGSCSRPATKTELGKE
jgi:hypothetical protein